MSFIPVNDKNTDRAIEILAEAFHDDPVMNWSCCNPPSLIPFFEFTLPVFIRHSLTYLDPEERGAASWLGPNDKLKWPVTFSSVRHIFEIGGFTGLYRMMRSGQTTERHHPKTPHYYLFAIGVTPDNKGKGLGTKLISHMLKRCDAEGMPAYLENSKEENLPFYEGHGFAVRKEVRFAPSAPPLWLMWREPVTAGK
jgi:GNAT superfamily N-acetyltransferase